MSYANARIWHRHDKQPCVCHHMVLKQAWKSTDCCPVVLCQRGHIKRQTLYFPLSFALPFACPTPPALLLLLLPHLEPLLGNMNLPFAVICSPSVPSNHTYTFRYAHLSRWEHGHFEGAVSHRSGSRPALCFTNGLQKGCESFTF